MGELGIVRESYGPIVMTNRIFDYYAAVGTQVENGARSLWKDLRQLQAIREKSPEEKRRIRNLQERLKTTVFDSKDSHLRDPGTARAILELHDSRLAGEWVSSWDSDAPQGGLPQISVPGWLPRGAWMIRFQFTLETPLLTKDDTAFYPFDNPIRKEKVFQWPVLAASGWKGCLRHGFRAFHGSKESQAENRIFGNALDGEEDGRAGRLICYPTYFREIQRVMISPHSRKTKTASTPIRYEAVREGEPGLFQVVYFPFEGDPDTVAQSRRDLTALAWAVGAVFQDLGLGAKTSSGFGRVKREGLNGRLHVKGRDPVAFATFEELVEVAGGKS